MHHSFFLSTDIRRTKISEAIGQDKKHEAQTGTLDGDDNDSYNLSD